MILITLGTQDKKFNRLLDEVQKQIDLGNIKDEVIVQAGFSADYKSKNMTILDLVPMDEFDKMIKKCDLLITHGGVGSIINGLKHNKKVIAVARLKKYGEHTNDHQIQIVNNFTEAGYILSLNDGEDLFVKLKLLKNFKPKKYKSNNKSFVEKLDNKIKSYIN